LYATAYRENISPCCGSGGTKSHDSLSDLYSEDWLQR
jgi:hypothetical protein